jgi:F-type H+-transporting ATPase subunit epsilon
MKTIAIEVITPDTTVLKEAVDFVLIPARRGPMGVLPGHAPFIGRLSRGTIRAERQGNSYYVAVGSGIFEIGPEQIRVVADSAKIVPDASFLDTTEER